MIAPPEHVVLADYAIELFEEVTNRIENRPSEQQKKMMKSRMMAVMICLIYDLNAVRNLSLFSSNGSLVRVSNRILETVSGQDRRGLESLTFAYIDTYTMRVDLHKVANSGRPRRQSSSEFKAAYRYDDRKIKQAEEFLAWDGYYLTCPSSELPHPSESKGFLKMLVSQKVKENTDALVVAENELRRRLLRGEVPIRDEFKKTFASCVKADAFRALWYSVAEDFPALSKPGPKGKSRNS